MSNALAIAAATATLRSLLIRGLGIPDVTIKPPDAARKSLTGNQVNLFLYQTSIDAAWRNHDMPRQVKPGETGQPPLPLCLYYLVTAFGEGDDESKAQQLLGQAMSVLHDHPLLGADEIRQATETDVAGSNLHEQVERVRITPQPLSLEEVSKLWSAFQTNYRLSTAYQVAVILIESTRSVRAPLPVLTQGKDDRGPSAQGNLIPPFPAIDRIDLPNGRSTALLNDPLTLVGHHFALNTGDPTQVAVSVQFNTTRLPQPLSAAIPINQRTDMQITVTIPHQAGVFYPAGLYLVSVNVMPTGKPLETRTTNELPLMLAPAIAQINGVNLPVPPAPPISVARVNVVNGLGDATLQIKCHPEVVPEQSAALLIGDRTVNAEAHTTQTDTLTFMAKQMAAGTYRLRLRIDGVDSPLIDLSDPTQPKFDDSQQVTLT
jgi:hypothetical protein